MPEPTRLLIPKPEAARSLGVSERTLFGLTAPRGDLPAVQIGSRILYDPVDLRDWIDRRKVKPGAETAPQK